MRDYLNIGPTPADEPCVPVGHPDYNKLSRIECTAFIRQLHRVLIKEFPEYTVTLHAKSFPHDFGTYKEVVVNYDIDNEEETKQAFYLEDACSNWDEEALQELKEAGYSYESSNSSY